MNQIMNPDKSAAARYPISEVIRKRWSPRAFDPRPVEKEKLQQVFEAARWAPSSANDQPWRFLVGLKGDETWSGIHEALDEGNRAWTRDVPVLILAIGRKMREKVNRLNSYYAYDTGQSVAYLSLEATRIGLHVHQMAGFDQDRASLRFGIPPEYEPLTVIAAGYLGDPSTLEEFQHKREIAPRVRKPLEELVFGSSFGKTSPLFE
ncbi:MAG TPA: nitroreductase family protein [Bacteroidales bacterium]|nr:nitroreductase family protein [Bacteroidales bacterium]